MADQNDQLSDIQASAGTNLSLLVGQLQGGFRQIQQMLLDQNAQHVRDGTEARADRERRHEENKTEIRNLSDSIDGTAMMAKDSAKWIADEGRPLVKRVSDIEEGNTISAAESRGRKAAWGLIYAGIGAALTAIGAFGHEALGKLGEMIHGG